MLRMNPEVRAQWAAAIRSGEYKQGRGNLNYLPRTGERRFCCLGVLCELAAEAGIVTRTEDSEFMYTEYINPADHTDSSETSLPKAVQVWAGLDSDDPKLFLPTGTYFGTCSDVNDNNVPFSEIADLIDGGSDASS